MAKAEPTPSPANSNGTSTTNQTQTGTPRFPSLIRQSTTAAERAQQAFEQRQLCGVHSLACLFDPEILSPIDLGELALLAGARRPFEREGVAVKARQIQITGERPGVDQLAALVFHRAQLEGLA